MKPFRCILLFLLLSACSKVPGSPPAPQNFISFGATRTRLENELKQMNLPYGVLPAVLCSHVPKKRRFCPANGTHPYFIFDKNIALFILNSDLFSYVKVSSSKLFFHLYNEWQQLRGGKKPGEKTVSSQIFRTEKSGEAIEIFFSPKEVYFLRSGKNSGRLKGLWEKIYKKEELLLYFEYMKEETLYADMKKQFYEGKNRFIASEQNFFDDFVLNQSSPGFNFILSEDSFTVFSHDPGNSRDKENNYLEQKHGFVLHMELESSKIVAFLQKQGFSLSLKENLFLAVKKEPGVLALNWNGSEETDVYAGECSKNLEKIITVKRSFYRWAYPEEGKKYCLQIIRGRQQAAAEILVSAEPGLGDLIFTEFMWMGSYKGEHSQAHDEWFEFKNVSDRHLSLKNLSFIIQRESSEPYLVINPSSNESNHKALERIIEPGAYFVISKDMDKKYLFADLNLEKVAFRSGGQSNSQVFTMQIYNRGQLITEQTVSHSAGLNNGSTAEPPYVRRSMVRLKDGAWGSSNEAIDISGYRGHSYGSPGYGGREEF